MARPLGPPAPAWGGMPAPHVRGAPVGGRRVRPLAAPPGGAPDASAEDGVGLTPEREADLLAAWRER